MNQETLNKRWLRCTIVRVRLKRTQAARKHRLGSARIAHVMSTTRPTVSTRPSGEPEYSWVGPDDRGLELEIIAVMVTTEQGEPVMLVILAMPTSLRRS